MEIQESDHKNHIAFDFVVSTGKGKYSEAQQAKMQELMNNPDLTEDTSQLIIPHMPVLHMALALAARERGETGGRSAGELLSFAQNYLSDAIALDAYKHPEEMVYRAV